ncbi:GGDEF domain-containing protein [Rhizobium sp. TRM95111]|uniref:GGDEF domain-containing protein n=1 Tax=Rhizobium alarense TaxID=2846851 RepID=UPI001F1F47C1|nr:GGDEF domain-containing protein [Rhizobium alarense]MCF3641507.1 GGDEF domain-containing protein [Rhizobium alarense]
MTKPPAIHAKIGQAMASLGISGLPRNYELLHEAFTRGNPEIGRDIAALGAHADQAELDAIGLRHALTAHHAIATAQAAAQAATIVSDVIAETERSRRTKAIALQEIREAAGRMRADPAFALSERADEAQRLLSVVETLVAGDARLTETADALLARLKTLKAGMDVGAEALTHDPVTGFANRAMFLARLKPLFEEREAEDAVSGLLLLQVARLRDLTETHQPGVADDCVRRLATILRTSVKKQDFVARLGTDQFALVLSDVSRENAQTIAARIHARIAAESFALPGRALPAGLLSAVTGIAMTDAAQSAEALADQAQQALSVALEAGIGEIRLYSAEVAARAAPAYRRGVA